MTVEYVDEPMEWVPGVFQMKRAIYLAGSVEGNWRDELGWSLRKEKRRYAILSPRRGDPSGVFKAANYSQDRRHMEWESDHLARAERVAFWFQAGEPCELAFFQLHDALISGKRMAIGLKPGYPLERFVRFAVARMRPDVEIVHSLPALADAVLRAKLRVSRVVG